MFTLAALQSAHAQTSERHARDGLWGHVTQLARSARSALHTPRCLTCHAALPSLLGHRAGLCERCEWVCLEWRARARSGSSEAPWILSLATYYGPLHERLISAKNGDPADTRSLTRLLSFRPERAHHAPATLRDSAITIIPIPPRPARLKSSGASLPYELAVSLWRLIQGESTLTPHALQRVKDSPPQASLSRAQRAKAQLQSLTATRALYGQRVCLIDDVCTTGATLEEARRACLEAGALAVEALCLFSAR